jgi:hypothetical protein
MAGSKVKARVFINCGQNKVSDQPIILAKKLIAATISDANFKAYITI